MNDSSEDVKAKNEGKKELLVFLIGIAQKTNGAEVWRALFAEQYKRLEDK